MIKEQKNQFYSHNFQIFQFANKKVEQGEYSFPFCFLLDAGLPGSFDHKWNENGKENYGRIKYEIWAGLKNEIDGNILYDNYEIILNQRFEMTDST